MVDGHTHVWATWPYRPGVPDPQTRGSVENLLHEMDASGVDHALVVSAEIDGAAGNNDHGASVVAQHPGRFSQLVDLDSHFGPDYHRPGSADRLRAVVDRYAPVGVSHYLAAEDDGWLGSTEGDAFLAVAEEAECRRQPRRPAGVGTRDPRCRASPPRSHHPAQPPRHRDAPPGRPRGGAPAGRRRRGHCPTSSSRSPAGPTAPTGPGTTRTRTGSPSSAAFHEAWGPDRLAWGSDWPSLLPHHSYRQGRELLTEHATFLNPEELDKVMGGTLARVLRLPVGVPA